MSLVRVEGNITQERGNTGEQIEIALSSFPTQAVSVQSLVQSVLYYLPCTFEVSILSYHCKIKSGFFLTTDINFFLPYRKKITSCHLLCRLAGNVLSKKTSKLRMEQERAVQECLSTQTVSKIGEQGYRRLGSVFCFHEQQDRSS